MRSQNRVMHVGLILMGNRTLLFFTSYVRVMIPYDSFSCASVNLFLLCPAKNIRVHRESWVQLQTNRMS
jgi:hypothetical protein